MTFALETNSATASTSTVGRTIAPCRSRDGSDLGEAQRGLRSKEEGKVVAMPQGW